MYILLPREDFLRCLKEEHILLEGEGLLLLPPEKEDLPLPPHLQEAGAAGRQRIIFFQKRKIFYVWLGKT